MPFTRRNLKQDVEDVGSGFDGAPGLEFHSATAALELEHSGLSLQRIPPRYRFPYGHTHKTQEELYVVVRGSGRMKLDDEIVELAEWDAVRVPPGTWRGLRGGAGRSRAPRHGRARSRRGASRGRRGPARLVGRRVGGTSPPAMRVLLTGMSGTGKSTLVQELRRRGLAAYDADDDGFSEPRADGRWGWRADAVAALLAGSPDDDLLFFAGCSEEQIELPFDLRVVLTVPEDELMARLRTRTSNAYGRTPAERSQVLADLADVEPLLRGSADLVLSTDAPVAAVADRLLEHVAAHATDIA